MSLRFNAADYFIAPHATFWRWEDHGQVVAWVDGRAIAYRPQIEQVVSRLALQGLPSFDAVLLVMAACRDNWAESPLRRDVLGDVLRQLTNSDGGGPGRFVLVNNAVSTLEFVHEAWRQMRDIPKVTARLSAVLFDHQTDLPTIGQDELLRQLHNGALGTRRWPIANALCKARLLQSLAELEKLKSASTATLIARVQAGVDDIVTAAPVEPLESIGSARDLLSSLEDDPELAGVAEIARRVLATLNLPRAVSDPDELPDGGLSDITNRGTLDRLLLSELAHDDLTLAVRVALREALYLRREAPPRTPPQRRAVLIDIGLRMWGVPRLFATGVALAIAAHSDSAFDLTVARSAADDAVPVDLRSRAGVLQHLEALDHRVHPAGALATLVDSLEEDAAELVLITTDDVLADPSFITALGKLQLSTLYIATVTRDGQYRLIARSGAGTRVLSAATFDLDQILARRTSKSPLYQRDEQQPAINRAAVFPLFLSANVQPERAWHAGFHIGVLSLTKDGRLLRWGEPGRGGELVAEHMPSGHVQCAERNGDVITAVVGPLKKTGLHVIRVEYDPAGHRSQRHALSLVHEHPLGVSGYAGLIFVMFKDRCEAFNQQGRRLDEFLYPNGVVWVRGRFLKKHRWFALGWNGTKIEMHPVAIAGVREIVAVLEGPTLISSDGAATYLHQDTQTYQFAPSSGGKGKVSWVSRDERFLLYHADYQREPWPLLVDLWSRQSHIYRGKTSQFLEPLLPQYVRPRVARYRFNSIGIDNERRITLFTSGGAWPLTLAADGNLLLPKRPTKITKCERINFQARDRSSPYDARIATWPDGSVAMLDSRGLLHLRSSYAAIPECSIVLVEGETAGWVADGRWWGSTYYIGENPRTAPFAIYQTVLRPFVERLP